MDMGTSLTDAEKQWRRHFERKLDELADNCTYRTAFLDPRQIELAEAVLRGKPELAYTVYGGFPRSERNVLNVFPARHAGNLPPVALIAVRSSGEDQSFSHRDLLGAVMALGLRRDQIGDIVLSSAKEATMAVDPAKGEFICVNLKQVGRFTVDCRLIEPEEILPVEDDGREIKGTVAALRLDAVLSLGFGISRSRVVLLVKAGLAGVNWRPVNSPSYKLKEGDKLSLKGKGRLLITSVEGETRKGRIRLKLKKYS